jgi:hypothetical protein
MAAQRSNEGLCVSDGDQKHRKIIRFREEEEGEEEEEQEAEDVLTVQVEIG